jgi:flagellar biosynthetic protein FliP
MGLFLYVPLLLVDLLVAGILMSLGMMMVPPPLISLPVKVAIFVMADGWRLVVASLVRSFQ